MSSFVQSELLDCFSDEQLANTAHEYLTSFMHLINQHSPGLLKESLIKYATMIKSKPNDFNFNILLLSGKKWLQSDSANMDVRLVPVHHRSAMYLVGNTFTETDKDLLKGSTFVWSEKIDVILAQFTSLMNFAHAMKWQTMKPYLHQVGHAYMLTQELDPSEDNERICDLTATKLVNTNLVFGLLTEMLLETPTDPNGPTLIYRYLAGATVKLNHKNEVSLRNHNEISKNANALLRLFRHGVCSMYVRKSSEMSRKNQSHEEFEAWTNNVIKQMQVCHSIGHICRTIRTAREVDRKSPSKVQKAFNEITGELFVAGCHIHKSTWSVAIPTAIAKWDKVLFEFFPNHSDLSSLPLHWIFDLNNDVVLAGHDSFISITDTNVSIPLREYLPVFPE
jgi:hypothetical protein